MFFSSLLWLAIISLLFWLIATDRYTSSRDRWVPAVFFLSGFPALIYQIVWQRALFVVFGANIESVTIVVTAFILGLGIGSLLGGWISSHVRSPLAIFGASELGVGLFGLVSLPLFHQAALHAATLSILQTAFLSFFLVLVPTAMMGSTLPCLVAHLLRGQGNTVGHSVGRLYFVNTLGSALACFLCVQFLMRILGEHGAVWSACAINVAVGLFALIKARKSPIAGELRPQSKDETGSLLPYGIALLLAFITGFIALAYEILWYRLYSFTTGGRAFGFANLLGAYLLGLASGSLITDTLCRREAAGKISLHAGIVGTLLIGFNLLGFMVAPLLGWTVQWFGYGPALLLVSAASACLGSAFPLVAHLSFRQGNDAGRALGGLYFANMVGSAIGSLAIGFYLTQIWAFPQITAAIAFSGVLCGALILAATRRSFSLAFVAVVIALLILPASRTLHQHLYEKLLYKKDYKDSTAFSRIVENRNGIIAVDGNAHDSIFGGGIYDGKFNTDLVHDTNGIVRCFATSGFHPAPKNVLMIGLSSGSWAQVIASNQAVENLTVVEINPGYLKLIAEYPQTASVLQNPKVKIVIDDGRRWLNRNTDSKFDLIVMNTTFHWRAHVSNLLSLEFLTLVRSHLLPGGILFYNTTHSSDVQRTGTSAFAYGLRIGSFLAVSDAPVHLDSERWKQALLRYQIDGHPVLNLKNTDDRQKLDELLLMASQTGYISTNEFMNVEDAETLRSRYSKSRLITDDNMGTEWYGDDELQLQYAK